MHKRYFSDIVVKWYHQNKRELPWRMTRDPYKIWLSEVILQQTRVAQGTPYYHSFLQKFPSVRHLAEAPEQEVLRQWQGLGYYTRARNLHKCARVVHFDHHGSFPNSYQELKNLPGIGDYTAAAIASISFGEPVAVVDGNVYRVLARLFGLETPINSPEGKKVFARLANELMDPRQPEIFNQAVMEFGALQCVPKNPDCTACVFQKSCIANKSQLQDVLPVKKAIKKIRHRYLYYFVIQHGRTLLMQKRNQKDIWHGLFDFYRIESKKNVSLQGILKSDRFLKKLGPSIAVGNAKKYKHILSHQVIHATFSHVDMKGKAVRKPEGFHFYTAKKIKELPKAVLINRYLADQELL